MSNEEEKETTEKAEAPQWEKREFAINESMKKVCEAARVATKAEISNLKRKLSKLQYGG